MKRWVTAGLKNKSVPSLSVNVSGVTRRSREACCGKSVNIYLLELSKLCKMQFPNANSSAAECCNSVLIA